MHITLEDLEGTAPPGQVLKLAQVGEGVFISIEQYTETFEGSRQEIIVGEPFSEDHKKDFDNRASMCVSAGQLYDALRTLSSAEELRREAQESLGRFPATKRVDGLDDHSDTE